MKKLLYKVLVKIFEMLGRELTDEVFQGIIEFVKFGIVGASNTIISYVIYAGCLLLLQSNNLFVEIDYLISQVLSFGLSVLWSFYWNNKYVFVIEENEERSIFKALIKTYISYSFTGLFLNSILLILWVRVFNISELVAPIINLVVSVPLNFLINKFWAFKAN